MTDKIKNFLSLFLRIGLSGGLLVYLFSQMDMARLGEVLKGADFRFIFYALAVFFAIHAVLLFRWFIFIKALDFTVSLKTMVNYFFIGLFFNLFLPTSTGGDVVKIIGVCKESNEKAKVVGSVVLDRLSGFAAMVVVAFAAFVLGYRFIGDRTLIVPIMIMAGAALVLFTVLFNEKVYSFFCGVFNRFPKIKEAVMQLHYDVALLKDRKSAVAAAIGVSSMTQVLLAFTFYLVARALHQDIAMVYFFIFVPIICVVASLPSIGGLGVRDAGSAYLFAKIGVGAATAVSITLINFLFMVAIGLIGGVIYVTALSPGRVQRHQENVNVGLKKA